MATNLIGSYPSMSTPPHNQVYGLTHDGDAKRSFVSRAYLSFSYGGKDIEDFGLIATFSDDGKTGNLYGNFEDITSSYSMLDGQFYWGSHFTTNTINFDLATDGMTQKELDDFKFWFRPGQVGKELILSEHPNRAILARVAQPPTYTLIPFEYKEKFKNQKTTTALYKGRIQISFVMDNPFWYLKNNYIAYGNLSMANEDNRKIMLEDNIPYQDYGLLTNCFYGGRRFWNGLGWGAIASEDSSYNPYNQVNSAILSHIATLSEQTSLELAASKPNDVYSEFYGEKQDDVIILSLRLKVPLRWLTALETWVSYSYKINDENDSAYTYDTYKNNNNEIVNQYSLQSQIRNGYLYLDGERWKMRDAHCHGIPISDINEIHFKLEVSRKPTIDQTFIETIEYTLDFSNGSIGFATYSSQGAIIPPRLVYSGNAPTYPILNFSLVPQIDNYFISAPFNNYYSNNNNKKYNSIYFTNKNSVKEFNFTIPEVFDSYNQVINMVNTNSTWFVSWPEFIDELKSTVRHPRVRAYAIQLSEYCSESAEYATIKDQGEGAERGFFKALMQKFLTGDNNTAQSAIFTFNSATGTAQGTFATYTTTNFTNFSKITYTENVGSMVRSNYLMLDYQNQLINGIPALNDVCTITTDYPATLSNFLVLYNNMYY